MARDGWAMEQLEAKGAPLPSWYTEEPELHQADLFYLSAFWELSSCRNFGWVIGPIPWTALNDYADFSGLDSGMRKVFVAVIRELDEIYLSWQRDNVKKTAEAEKPKKVEE